MEFGFQSVCLTYKSFFFEVVNGSKFSVGYHMSPKYFPNPEQFDPERFNDENKRAIIQGSYLPFSIGPRNCVVN